MVLHAMMSYGSMRELELMLCAAWAIWKNRNNLLHDENVLWTHQNIYGRWWKVTRVWFLKWYRRRIINRADLAILTWGPNYDNDTTIKKNTKNIRTYYSNLFIYKNNARDTNYLPKKKNYKLLMWRIIISKWKNDINGGSRWKLIRDWPHQHFINGLLL